jgi:hypothetical protein
MIITNIPNKQQLVELFLKYRVGDIPFFKIKIQSNPFGEGTPRWLWASLQDNTYLDTLLCNQNNIDGVDYAYRSGWRDYEGTFDLDTAPFQNVKPEVYKEGDVVEVLESLKQMGRFGYYSEMQQQKMNDMVGKSFDITKVEDSGLGVFYVINDSYIPHYAVRKIVDFSDLENSETREIAEDEVTVKLSRKDYNKLIELLK